MLKLFVLSGHYRGSGFAGKSIGLYCDRLSLQDNVTIDVSGSNGVPGRPAASAGKDTSAVDGARGQNGGTIDIFVQNGLEDQIGSLKLIANGGNGGKGGDVEAADSGRVGRGGAGGDGGNVTVQYGSTASRLGAILTKAGSGSWQYGLSILSKAIAADPQSWENMGVDTGNLLNTMTTLQQQTMSISNLQTQLKLAVDAGLDDDVVVAAGPLLQRVNSLYANAAAPDMSPETIDAVRALSTSAAAYNSDPFDDDVRLQFVSDLQAFPMPNTQQGGGSFAQALNDVTYALKASYSDLVNDVKGMVTVNPGRGGRNGKTKTVSNGAASARGGAAGRVRVNNLAFDGRPRDVSVASPFMLPEQIQMVMDQANSLYYTNAPDNILEAQRLYLRMVERLSMTTALGTGSGFDSALQRLSKVSLSAANGLRRHSDWANSMCKQILAGQDMWAHEPNWAPRLAWPYFANRATKRISSLATLEGSFQTYMGRLDNQVKAADAISAVTPTLQQSAAEARTRMAYFSGDNGPLAAAAGRIDALTPVLVAKHSAFLALMPDLINKINDKTNLDWGSLIDAIGGFVFGVANGVAQLASKGFDFRTKIKDRDTGGFIDKSKVISDLREAGDSLADVATAWSTRQDGTITVDQAQSQKLLATQDQIKSILKEFQDGIPGGASDALVGALNDYNAKDSFGQAQLQLDPTLPSVVNWFKTRVNSEQLQVMRLINYGASAIRFWALADADKTESPSPGPLQGSSALTEDLNKLTDDFESVLTGYAVNTITDFPRSNQQGKFWQIPAAQLAELKTLHAENKALNSPAMYKAYVNVPAPHTDAALDDLPDNRRLFADNYNVRIKQIRVWLPGATVSSSSSASSGDQRRPLSVNILHHGSETLIDTEKVARSYNHDIVKFNFQYDTTGVNSVKDCTSDRVYDTQHVTQTTYDGSSQNPTPQTFAPIGPFATWMQILG
ncbi:hypothetical protein KVT40_004739 [Elsinoe batatas]|uniref:Uncharacterized protein n=1 Tax=Elsinoe batatas TaxID=2601811 RepID=A0A8K0PEX8_9PEZI|nr:hypothetical protein KVT40_004739 [Elsinoe batatas]